jgi:hypothetical protein
MKTKITIQLYADKYADNTLVQSILNKKFGFELNIETETERSRRLITLEEMLELKAYIEKALDNYEDALNFNPYVVRSHEK